jgi:hypothetical protein
MGRCGCFGRLGSSRTAGIGGGKGESVDPRRAECTGGVSATKDDSFVAEDGEGMVGAGEGWITGGVISFWSCWGDMEVVAYGVPAGTGTES